MPVALLARHCKAKSLHLIYTKGVLKTKERLQELLGSEMKIESHEIDEKAPAHRIVETLKTRKLPWADADVNYTAGTKHMAVAAYTLWTDSAPRGDAAYLSGEEILWDKKSPETLTSILELNEILKLNFGQIPSGKDKELETEVSLAIQDYIRLNSWEAYQELIPKIHGGKTKFALDDKPIILKSYNAEDDKNFKAGGIFDGFDWSLWLEVVKRPNDTGLPVKKDRTRLAKSEWLEHWLAEFIRPHFDEVAQGLQFTGSDDPEIDVLARKGPLLYLFSCTVDETDYLVKSKAFEAYQRSHRLGGDLTRYAVVSMAKEETLDRTLERVEEERWEGHDRFRVFGRQHIIGQKDRCAKGKAPMTLEEAIKEW